MADELNAGQDAPADDLRSMLSNAFDEASADPAPAAAPAEGQTPQAAETPAEAQARARDEAGRFTKAPAVTDKPEAAAAFDPQAPKDGQQPADPAQQAAAAPVGPPPGWSVAAKAAFETLPPAVKEAVAKRETEINQGFAKLAEYKGLDPWVEMARDNGQDLPTVLKAYTEAENLLERDFLGGINFLCQRYGIDPRQMASAFLGGQAPQQGQQPTGADPYVQKLTSLEQAVQQLMGTQQQREAEFERQQNEAVMTEIERFAADPKNKFFENVRADMALLYQTGKANTLEDAYQQACWLNPEIRQLQINEQLTQKQEEARRTVDQKLRAAGSLPAGAPLSDAGVSPKNQSLRATLSQAWDSAGASI